MFDVSFAGEFSPLVFEKAWNIYLMLYFLSGVISDIENIL
jgi:hypothetical protein